MVWKVSLFLFLFPFFHKTIHHLKSIKKKTPIKEKIGCGVLLIEAFMLFKPLFASFHKLITLRKKKKRLNMHNETKSKENHIQVRQ